MDYRTVLLYLAVIFLSGAIARRATKYNTLRFQTAEMAEVGACSRPYRKRELRWLFAAALPLILLSALRYRTGGDYDQYAVNYSRLVNAHSVSYIFTVDEPGYMFLMWLTSLVFKSDPQPWFALMAFLTVWSCFYAVYRLNKKTDYSVFVILFGLYFYLHSFNYVRQTFAAAMLLLAYIHAGKKAYPKAAILIVIAILFHRSSLIVALMYVFVLATRRYKSLYTLAAMLVLSVLVVVAPRILSRIPFLARYVKYTSHSISFGIGWLIDVIPIFLCSLFPPMGVRDETVSDCRRFVLFVVPARLMAYYTYGIGRLFITLSLFGFLTAALSMKRRTDRKLLKLIIYIVFIAYHLFYFGMANNSVVIPYRSIFIR